MRTWETFFADVLPDVPGCPEPTAERHLLRAARRLCCETLVWRADLPAITTAADQRDYLLLLPEGADVHRFVGAALAGQDIALEVMDGTSTAERLAGNRGAQRLLTRDRRTVTFLPSAPATGLSLVIEANLMPSDSAEGLDDAIGDQHAALIATGALSTLLKINKAPWSNPGLAMDTEREFKAGLDELRIAVWKAYTNRRPRGRAMFF